MRRRSAEVDVWSRIYFLVRSRWHFEKGKSVIIRGSVTDRAPCNRQNGRWVVMAGHRRHYSWRRGRQRYITYLHNIIQPQPIYTNGHNILPVQAINYAVVSDRTVAYRLFDSVVTIRTQSQTLCRIIYSPDLSRFPSMTRFGQKRPLIWRQTWNLSRWFQTFAVKALYLRSIFSNIVLFRRPATPLPINELNVDLHIENIMTPSIYELRCHPAFFFNSTTEKGRLGSLIVKK